MVIHGFEPALFYTGAVACTSGSAAKSRQKAYPLLHAPYAFLSPTASKVSVFICPSLRSARWDGFLQMGLERRAALRASPRVPQHVMGGGSGQNCAFCRCLSVRPRAERLGRVFFSKEGYCFRWPFCSLCKYHPLDSKLECLVWIRGEPGVLLIPLISWK